MTPLPERLDEFVCEDSPVCVDDAFVEESNRAATGFKGMVPA